MEEYCECKDCRYFRKDPDTGETWCNLSYSNTDRESSCDRFVIDD